MVKIAIIGATGQLGSDLCRELDSPTLVRLNHQDIEVADLHSVRKALQEHKPDVIINTAAFHKTDDCETNPDKAFLVNAIGARNVAVVAEELGAKLAYISTDYVFGGENRQEAIPYTEFDTPVPLSVYGKSKLAGETIIQHLCSRYFIVRASGFFGVAGSSGKGGNFVQTVLKLAQTSPELRMVADQVFSPTYTKDLAHKIAQLVTTEYYGIFHITNKGSCSWYQFAQEILRLAGKKPHLIPITSEEYATPARRPRFSVLDNYHLKLLGLHDMRTWQEALQDYMVAKGQIAEK